MESQKQFPIRSREELMTRPRPAFLVERTIHAHSLAALYGPPGAGKTFVALGIALCISTGKEWLGRKTMSGQVIYITPEGLSGLRARLMAWEVFHNTSAENFSYVCEAPQFLAEEDVDILIDCIKSSNFPRPVLIVIDTLARHMVGGDENSSQAMGQFIAGVDRLRQEFACAILIVHHTGKSATGSFKERGSTALRGAADTMILVCAKANRIEISCEKQKDSEPFNTVHAAMTSISLADDETSCVVIAANTDQHKIDQPLSQEKQKIIHLLAANPTGMKSKEIIVATKLAESSCYRYLAELTAAGLITKDEQAFYRTPETQSHNALAPNPLSILSHEIAQPLPSLSHPVRGGSEEGEKGVGQ